MRKFLYARVFQAQEYGFVTVCATKIEASKIAYAFNLRAKLLGIDGDLYFTRIANTVLVKCESLTALSPEEAWEKFVAECKSKRRTKTDLRKNYIRPHLRRFEFIGDQYCTRTQSSKQTRLLIKNWNRNLLRYQLHNIMQFTEGHESRTIRLISLESGKSAKEMHAMWLAALTRRERVAYVQPKTEEHNVAPAPPEAISFCAPILSEQQLEEQNPSLSIELFNRWEEVQHEFHDDLDAQPDFESMPLWGEEEPMLFNYDLAKLRAEENIGYAAERLLDQLLNDNDDSRTKFTY